MSQTVSTSEAIRQFKAAAEDHPALSRFPTPPGLLDYLCSPDGDLDLKDEVYGALIRIVQGGSEGAELATSLLWLGLSPGLGGIYRRGRSSFRGAAADLVSDLAEHFTSAIHRADLSRIKRVAATLIRNTERDFRLARRRDRARDARLVGLPEERGGGMAEEPPRLTPPPLRVEPQPLSAEAERERVRSRLLPLIGEDVELFLAVVIDGLNQREAAARLGISHDAARKRFQRALSRVRTGVPCPNRPRRTAFSRKGACAPRREVP